MKRKRLEWTHKGTRNKNEHSERQNSLCSRFAFSFSFTFSLFSSLSHLHLPLSHQLENKSNVRLFVQIILSQTLKVSDKKKKEIKESNKLPSWLYKHNTDADADVALTKNVIRNFNGLRALRVVVSCYTTETHSYFLFQDCVWYFFVSIVQWEFQEGELDTNATVGYHD